MITDICTLDQSFTGVENALALTEKCAAYCELSPRQTLQLRLLAEELLGMMRGILVNYEAEFYLESEAKDITIHLRAHADMDIPDSERKKIVEVSTSGENLAYRGVMGKVRKLLECGMFGGQESLAAASSLMFTGVEYDTYMIPNEWSLKRYMDTISALQDKAPQQWDELEKSIVANLADDVTVGVHADVAEVSIR
ncbi:MAG: hypothetical protein Q4E65_09880 [Clostridia bacterium]|nr:hypothetical protein [Clostridia bacterium]